MKINYDVLNEYRENNRIEAKKAIGGLPKSVWETYSSFANTYGGIILLGVEELEDKSFRPLVLPNAEKMVGDFWNEINNHSNISVNILTDKNVRIVSDEDYCIIEIEVPRADRHDRPVYIGPDPFKGSYRRNGEGDYHCTRNEVGNMFRDAGDDSMDTRIMERLLPDALNHETVQRYRNRLNSEKPKQVWRDLPDEEFLLMLGALGNDVNGVIRPTAAGLLMFGEDWCITKEFTHYFLDYQENDGTNERWTDRFISSSGDWSGNLYDFYYRVINRLSLSVKVPFKLDETATRVDDTPVHEALREALANALVNAGYYDERGLVVKNFPGVITIANPGNFRVPLQDAIHGGVSSPRNEAILKMFNLIGIGERAGSGIPKLYKVWADQKWSPPEYKEEFSPDRTILTLRIEQKVEEKVDVKVDAKVDVKITDKQLELLQLIRENPYITAIELSAKLRVTPQAASKRIQTLKRKGVLIRVGSDKDGSWVVS